MVEVSVIIPVYNQERYLAEAIDSVLVQTYRDFELIVVDDGSTDRTPEVIAAYAGRIRAFRQPNAGNASAFNHGVREARGEWLCWLGSDDVWEPTKLERQMEAVRGRGPSVAVAYTDVTVIDAGGRPLERARSPDPPRGRRLLLSLVRSDYINVSSILLRRSMLDEFGMLDEADRISSDYDLWLRLAGRCEFLHVPEPLIRYRVHPGQISQRRDAMERTGKRAAARAVRRMGPLWGAAGAVLRFVDEVRILPWQVSGGHYSLTNRLHALVDYAKILVNPQTP